MLGAVYYSRTRPLDNRENRNSNSRNYIRVGMCGSFAGAQNPL